MAEMRHGKSGTGAKLKKTTLRVRKGAEKAKKEREEANEPNLFKRKIEAERAEDYTRMNTD